MSKGVIMPQDTKYDIKLGPGSKKSLIISEAFMNLMNGFGNNSVRRNVDEKHALQQFEDIFARTGRFDKFLMVAVNPATNSISLIPRFPSDIARAVERSPIDHKGKILISTDLALAVLSKAFLKTLREDLDQFGANNWIESTRRVRFGDVDSTSDIQLGFGDLYNTGLVKVKFGKRSVNELKSFLKDMGYEIGTDRMEKEGDELQVEQKLYGDDQDNKDKADVPPLLKTKKTVVLDRIDKLNKALDEFVQVYEDYAEYDISELNMAMSGLVEKLNDLGLVGTEK